MITRFSMRAIFRMAAAATTNALRVMIVVDRQNRNFSIFNDAEYFTNSTAPMISHKSPEAQQRFLTIMDRMYTFSINSQSRNRYIRITKKLRVPIQCNPIGNAGDNSDNTDNALYVVLYTDANPGATTALNIQYTYQFRFIDP